VDSLELALERFLLYFLCNIIKVMWTENKIYNIGEVVIYKDEKFKCLQTHLSSVHFMPSDEPRLWTNNLKAVNLQTIVQDWNSSTYYFKDDYVLFSNILYINTKNHISNPFISPAHNKNIWHKVL
jgi:hypothetical protein